MNKTLPDTQYRDRLKFILDHGELIKETPQGNGAVTVFGYLPQMVFDLRECAPLITERKIGFWRRPIAEIFAFIRGVRNQDQLHQVGCDWWEQWNFRTREFGLEDRDLGPGSYGAAFHDFPMPAGRGFNQIAHVIEQIKKYPHVRTAFVSPWIPFLIGRGGYQKAVVSPCHGWIHLRVVNGFLDLHMFQRSADFPVGVPSNMIQYAALLLAFGQVTGYIARRFIHSFSDAHIYENQMANVCEMLKREPRPLPKMGLTKDTTDISSITADDFVISDYDPHPAIKDIPVGT